MAAIAGSTASVVKLKHLLILGEGVSAQFHNTPKRTRDQGTTGSLSSLPLPPPFPPSPAPSTNIKEYKENTVRVPVKLLDQINDLFGELTIAQWHKPIFRTFTQFS